MPLSYKLIVNHSLSDEENYEHGREVLLDSRLAHSSFYLRSDAVVCYLELCYFG